MGRNQGDIEHREADIVLVAAEAVGLVEEAAVGPVEAAVPVVAGAVVAHVAAFDHVLEVEAACYLVSLDTAEGNFVVFLLVAADTHMADLRILAVAFCYLAFHRHFHILQSLNTHSFLYRWIQILTQEHSLLGPTILSRVRTKMIEKNETYQSFSW